MIALKPICNFSAADTTESRVDRKPMEKKSICHRALRRIWRHASHFVSGAHAKNLIRSAVRMGNQSDRSITVFDVGANVGQTTVYLRSLLRGLGRVVIHAFEPFEDNYQQLLARIGQVPNVFAHRLAFGEVACERCIPLAPHSQWHSIANSHAYEREGAQRETISITTIDEFCSARGIEHITLLKTDTEGFDLSVLKGGTRLLQSKAVDVIVCEVGFDRFDLQHTYFAETFQYLLEHGYRLHRLEDQVESLAGPALPPLLYANAWFVRTP
jgi:FkbM family methyltransferase